MRRRCEWTATIAAVAVAGLTACAPINQSLRVDESAPLNLAERPDKAESNDADVEETSGAGLEFRLLRQRDENGLIAPDAMSRALREREALIQPSGQPSRVAPEVAGVRHSGWTTLGPLTVFGGRIKAFDIDPVDPRHMLAGAATGGIWHSEDAGASWAPVNDFLGSLAISSFARDASDPATIYAGTSEYEYTGTQGIGVLKSGDGGRSWMRLAATDPVTSLNWTYVTHVASHPTSPNVVFASTWNGAFRSTDGGATWNTVFSRIVFDGFAGLIRNVEFNPLAPDQVLLGLEDSAVAYSSDGGSTWTTVQLSPPVNKRHTGGVELAFAKTVNGLVYASVDRNGGELWRSMDAGHTWMLTGAPKHIADNNSNAIWVDPTNAQHLVVGGQRLWRSTNGGLTFSVISTGTDSATSPVSAHADHHAIVAEPGYNGASNARLYDANDGGIYRADNIQTTATFSGWTNLNNGLNAVQFWGGVASSSFGGLFVGGTQDNGTLSLQLTGNHWFHWFGGDGGVTTIDPTNPTLWYGEYVYASVARTFDAGVHAGFICVGITEADYTQCGSAATAQANFIAPFVLDLNLPTRLLVGADSLWVSDDARAPTPVWHVVKPPSSTLRNYVSAIAVRPGDSNTVWVGHNNGELYVSSNALSTGPVWRTVAGLPARFITRIVFDPSNANRIYVALGGFVNGNLYVTDNGGTSWTSIGASLPAAPIYTLAIARANSQLLYVGTQIGVFASENGGHTWSASNDGPANVPVEELSWLADNALVAATHGRGAFLTLTDGSGPVDVVEFYDAQLDHYFMTASPSDINILDSGVISGWARTGQTFQGFLTQASGGLGVNPVCRFYIPPEHGNSHFFSVLASDCAALVAAAADPTHYPDFSGYVEESTTAFFIAVPDAAGNCPIGKMPVFRLWNQRVDSNHRYTTDVRTVEDMQARNYVLEGSAPGHAVMCASM